MADLASLLLLLVFFLAPAVDEAALTEAKGSRPCCLVLPLADPVLPAPAVLARWGVLWAGDLPSSAPLWPKMDEGSSAAAALVLLLDLFAAVDSGETRLAPPAALLAEDELVMGEDVAIVAVAALDVPVFVVAASSIWRVPVKFLRDSWALFPLPVNPCRKEIMLASSSPMLDAWSAGVRRKLTPLKVRVMDVSSAEAGAGAEGAPTSATAVGAADILEGMTTRWLEMRRVGRGYE